MSPREDGALLKVDSFRVLANDLFPMRQRFGPLTLFFEPGSLFDEDRQIIMCGDRRGEFYELRSSKR
jgi:hypothetical protein